MFFVSYESSSFHCYELSLVFLPYYLVCFTLFMFVVFIFNIRSVRVMCCCVPFDSS